MTRAQDTLGEDKYQKFLFQLMRKVEDAALPCGGALEKPLSQIQEVRDIISQYFPEKLPEGNVLDREGQLWKRGGEAIGEEGGQRTKTPRIEARQDNNRDNQWKRQDTSWSCRTWQTPAKRPRVDAYSTRGDEWHQWHSQSQSHTQHHGRQHKGEGRTRQSNGQWTQSKRETWNQWEENTWWTRDAYTDKNWGRNEVWYESPSVNERTQGQWNQRW